MKTWAEKYSGRLLLAAILFINEFSGQPTFAAATPDIAAQPMSQSLLAGTNATFSVTATGQGTLFYQWLLNGTNLTESPHANGSTNAILTINNLVAGDGGNYQVTVTNSHGSVTSSNATLTVLFPAAITGQPTNQSVVLTGNASFTVTATGTGTLYYQWLYSGNPLSDSGRFSGATSTTLNIGNVQTNDAGLYQVIVTNDYGSVTSTVAVLDVLVPAVITVQPSSQTVLLHSNVTFSGSARGTAPLSYHWFFNGLPLTDDGHINSSTSTDLTLANVQTNDAGSYQLVATNNYGSATSSVAALTVLVAATITSQPTNQSVLLSSNAVIAVAADGTVPISYQWYFKGVPLANDGHFSGTTTASLAIASVQPADAGAYQLVVTNNYAAVTSAVANLTVLVPPYLTSQPTNEAILLNSNVTFVAGADGTAPLNFQWYFNNTSLADNGHLNGVTTTNLNIESVRTNDAGIYQLIVTNNYGAVTSAVATLTVLVPATITSQPTNQSIVITSNASFAVTAIGTGTLNYQWQRDGTDLLDDGTIIGATSATLRLSNAQASDAGAYQVIVANDYGSVTSAVATLTILFPPSIGIQPADQSILLQSNASFSATTGGTEPLFHQWYFEGVPLTDDGRIGGATATNLFIANVGTNDAGVYHLVVTNDYGSVTSAVATLTVLVPAIITGQPASQAVLIASNTSFSVSVIGDPPLNFQWFFNGMPLTDNGHFSGSQSGSLGISNVQTSDAGSYQVVVTNNYGSATSYVATVTVLVPPAITSQPASQPVVLNGNASFSTAVTGDSPLHCQWYFQGAPMANNGHVSGSITTNLIIANVQTNDAGSYQLIVTNIFGSATSSVADLTILLPPEIIIQPSSRLALPGGNAVFNVTATSTEPLFYQWQKNSTNLVDGGNISGSLTTNLIVNDITTNDVGRYTVIITNDLGSATSSVAGLAVMLPITPTNRLAFVGNAATLNVIVVGDGMFAYQWQLNGTNLSNGFITTVAGNGVAGYSGDGGPATNASLNNPYSMATDHLDLLIADGANNVIRKVDANGVISTIAGNGDNGYLGDGRQAIYASLSQPTDVAMSSGNLFIADRDNNRIRKVSPSGVISTIAGNGGSFYYGDGGQATQANIYKPLGVALDAIGNVFIADTLNNRIRKVSLNGIITTVTTGNLPSGVATASSGDLFIADTANNRIVKVGSAGTITTVAGGQNGYSGDGGPAINAKLNRPRGVTVDFNGNLFIADTSNNRIRKIATNGIISTVAGNGNGGYSGDEGIATNAMLNQPYRVALDTYGNLLIADSSNMRIRKVSLFSSYPALNLGGLSANDAGDYRVFISSLNDCVTSSIVSLTVATQPRSVLVTNGSPSSFNISVFGVPPTSFHWQKNGINLTDDDKITGSLTSNLLLKTSSIEDAGNYTIVIANSSGNSITSSVASLFVRQTGNTTLAQWSFDGQSGSLLPSCGDTNIGATLNSFKYGSAATIVYGASNPWYTTNGNSAIFQNTSGVNTTGVGLFCNDSGLNGPLDLSLATNFTLEAFVMPYDLRQAAIIRKDGGAGGYYIDQRLDGHFGFRLKGDSQDLGDMMECNDLPYTSNQWFHVALVWNGTSAKFYVNGVQSHDLGPGHLSEVPFTGMIGDSTGSLGIGAFVQGNANPPASASQFFRGLIDEVRISDSTVPPSEFLIDQGTYQGPPLIISQPASISVPAGLNPIFFASAIGPALSWQWQFNNTNIIGATNYFCQLFNVSYASAGQYSVIISNAYGITNSHNAALSVTAHSWQSGLALSYIENGLSMPYRLYLPLNYNPATQYPVVIFLHGSGSVGTNNTSQVSANIAGLIAQTYSNYPAILVAPQVLNYWNPSNPDDLTLGILADVRRSYSVDDRRIYLTGFSLGGIGTTDYAFSFPNLFAAIAPLAGTDPYLPGDQLPLIPTWLFNGSADTVWPVSYAELYYTNATGLTTIVFNQSNYGYPTAVSEPIRFTELTGQGHNIGAFIYGNSATDLYDWMFAQIRLPSSIELSNAILNNHELIVSGFDSVPFATGYLLSSTNLQTPLAQWQRIATNWCDINGLLTFTNKVDSHLSQRFYLLQSQ